MNQQFVGIRGLRGAARPLLTTLLAVWLLAGTVAASAAQEAEQDQGAATATEQQRDVFSRLPNALGAQNTTRNQGSVQRGGLYYQRWRVGTGYLLTANIMRDEAARSAYSDATLFAYELRGDLMRRVFSGDVADWLGGALFIYGNLAHGGRIDVDVDADFPETEEEFDNFEPTRSIEPFVPSLSAAVGVGLEAVLLSHYSLLFELGYGPAVDLYPFELRFFGLGFTFGTAIRF